MKKLLLLLLIAISTSGVSASNAELFQLDEVTINEVFSELNELEEFLLLNDELTLTELNTNPTLKSSLGMETTNLVERMAPSEHPMGIPSFCWGGCFGIAGVFLAYIFSDQDKEEAKKALYGCLVQSIVGSIGYVILLFTAVNAFP